MGAAILQCRSPVPELRHEVDRLLQDVWEPPAKPVPNPDEAVLVSAAYMRRLISQETVLELQAIRSLRRIPIVIQAVEREVNRLTELVARTAKALRLVMARGDSSKTRVNGAIDCGRIEPVEWR